MATAAVSSGQASTRRSWATRLRPWDWVVVAAMVGFPLLRLLPLDATFHRDWYNHLWLTGYPGEYLRQHGALPIVINTTEQAGLPFPIFYAPVFYPLLAPLTAWVDPGLVIRAVVLLVTALQLHLISAALRANAVPPWIARGVACLVIWAIYPLTNLYNRSAITEYVATALLTCVLATWFLLLRADQPSERKRYGLGLGLLFTLAAGTHAITALYSLPVLVLMVVAAYHEGGRDRAFWSAVVRALVPPVALSAIVLAPWLYALRKFSRYLAINQGDSSPDFFIHSIDRWRTRFSPLPSDPRTLRLPLPKVSTPYLDAQINIAILVLLIGWLAIIACRSRSSALAGLRATLIAMLAFAGFTWLSLRPSAFAHLPSIANMVQFAYRLVTYENLALLLGALQLAASLRRRGDRSLFEHSAAAAAVLAGCLVISGAGVVIKWQHASAIMNKAEVLGVRLKPVDRPDWGALDVAFYGADNYVTAALYTALTDGEQSGSLEVRIPIGSGTDFGTPQPLRLQNPTDAWIRTNVQAFPWNELHIDGVPVTQDRLRVHSQWLAVRVPAGDHVLTLTAAPDELWRVLRASSFGVLAIWLGYVLYASLKLRAAAR